jgi:hypothetical protein
MLRAIADIAKFLIFIGFLLGVFVGAMVCNWLHNPM